jgi:DNA-directed RNA polymerase specialized sigma24 family protein
MSAQSLELDARPRTATRPQWRSEELPRVSEVATLPISQTVDDVYRTESRRVFATLIRLLGDFDLAEDALHDAFRAALEQWERDGVPANPRAWLVSAGRFKAIDGMRRRARFDASLATLATQLETSTEDEVDLDDPSIADDRLRLIFTCCHPALSPEARVALTLREVCGRPARWPSASCVPKRKFAMRGFPIRCRRLRSSRSGWTPSCASSISSSTRAIPPHRVTP